MLRSYRFLPVVTTTKCNFHTCWFELFNHFQLKNYSIMVISSLLFYIASVQKRSSYGIQSFFNVFLLKKNDQVCLISQLYSRKIRRRLICVGNHFYAGKITWILKLFSKLLIYVTWIAQTVCDSIMWSDSNLHHRVEREFSALILVIVKLSCKNKVLIIEFLSYCQDLLLYFRLTGETGDGHLLGCSALGNPQIPTVKVGEAAANEKFDSIYQSIYINHYLQDHVILNVIFFQVKCFNISRLISGGTLLQE